jgi:NTE family protein
VSAGVNYAGSTMQTPDVLVLGGGGTLGEAWMSAVLAGLEQGADFDAHGCSRYVGTSAGSIVAASLVAGLAPDARLGETSQAQAAQPPQPDGRAAGLRQAFAGAAGLAGAATAPLASLALASSAKGGALIRRTILRNVPPGTRSLAELGRMVELANVPWDGRLRIVAVELGSGRRVVFGAAGEPQPRVSVAVEASCAIPGVFRPILAGGRTYVDGGAWSPTNIDAAEAERGERVLCLNPTGSLRPAAGSLAGALGPVSRGLAATEALALRRRGVGVRTINPDEASMAGIGSDFMDPARRGGVIEAGIAQGRELARRERRRAA